MRLERIHAAKATLEAGELNTARTIIAGLLEKGNSFGDSLALARMEDHVEAVLGDHRQHLNREIDGVLAALDAEDSTAVNDRLSRVESLRDELDEKIERVRSDMLQLLSADANITLRSQRQVMLIGLVLTALAAALGLLVSALVSSGLTRSVRRLLEGTRAVVSGQLDHTIRISSQDEIGHQVIQPTA